MLGRALCISRCNALPPSWPLLLNRGFLRPSTGTVFVWWDEQVPNSPRVLDPSATLAWFCRPIEAVARGVAAVAGKRLLGATGESWVSFWDHSGWNTPKEARPVPHQRCYPSTEKRGRLGKGLTTLSGNEKPRLLCKHPPK